MFPCISALHWARYGPSVVTNIWLTTSNMFDPLSLKLKLLKGDMYWFFPGKILPRFLFKW